METKPNGWTFTHQEILNGTLLKNLYGHIRNLQIEQQNFQFNVNLVKMYAGYNQNEIGTHSYYLTVIFTLS